MRPGSVAVSTSYDGYGRLLTYARTGDPSQANAYNGLDDRVSVTSGGTTHSFVYDPDGRMIGEYGTSATDVIAETIWLSPEVAANDNQPLGGDDGAGGYAPLAVVTGSGASTALYWVHGNHLGVPIVTTDASGAAASPTGFTMVGFPGQTRTLADLYYNRYRDYDPSTGRYIQADPIGLAGGSNPYAYVGGNPVNAVDPMGLETIWEHYTGLPDSYRKNAINAIAGASDAATLGVTHWVREQIGANRDVDECSTVYRGGEVAGVVAGTVFGGAAGLRAAGTRGAGREFSHWIPARMGGPRSLWNGNYVTIERHALSDPYRYRFMPRTWKAANPLPSRVGQQWVRVPNVYKGAAAGGAATGAASSMCGCSQ
jgi:RHS repeat-associated protein